MQECNYCGAKTLEHVRRQRYCTECQRIMGWKYPQQDDHCWLVADRWDWHIDEDSRQGFMFRCEHPAGGVMRAVITGPSDWSGYCDKAVALLSGQADGLATELFGPDVTQ